jgi:hypothetical protein
VQYSFSGQFDENPIPYINLPADSTGWTTDAFGDGTRVWFRSRAYGNGQDTAYSPKRYAITHLPVPAITTVTALSATQIKVQFTDNSQNETHFQVYRSTASTGPFSPVGSPILSGQPTEFTDSGLTPNTPYYYYVRARNAVIDSSPSNAGNATTQPATPATPPTGLTATYVHASSRIDTDWADNTGSGVTYNLYRSIVESFVPSASTLRAPGLTTSSFSDSSVASNVRYYYGVTAVTAPESESFCVSYASTITQINAQPTNIVLSLADEATIDVFWSDQSGNETGYDVYHRGGVFADWTLAGSLPSDATFFTDAGLEEDTEYEYMVDALHSAQTPPAPTSQPGTTRFAEEYRGLIQVFLGLNAHPDQYGGMEQLVFELRQISVFTAGGELKYRVKPYATIDENIQNNGTGKASMDFLAARDDQGVQDFAILGHSFGGGATYQLADWARPSTNPGGIVANLRYTGYVDAIKRGAVGWPAEDRLPPNSMWHETYYQTDVGGLRGESIPGSNVNDEVTNAEHGGDINHTNIDNSAYVHTQIINSIKNRMPLNTIQ